jgi:uncharacterized protein YbcI
MDPQRPDGPELAAISNGLAHLHVASYGRGPTRTKTHAVDDTVVCVLWDGFTVVERTLIEAGEEAAVRSLRHSFQRAMETEFVAVVEAATGRAVIAYMSTVSVEPDVALEVFLLAPAPEPVQAG